MFVSLDTVGETVFEGTRNPLRLVTTRTILLDLLCGVHLTGNINATSFFEVERNICRNLVLV